MACLGEPTKLFLVDEGGEQVRARGELRLNSEKYAGSVEIFDCTTESDTCADGVLTTHDAGGTDASLELRFQLEDGSFTEWQSFELETTEHTDPDFNGPDCPCTSYSAKALSVVVPKAAR